MSYYHIYQPPPKIWEESEIVGNWTCLPVPPLIIMHRCTGHPTYHTANAIVDMVIDLHGSAREGVDREGSRLRTALDGQTNSVKKNRIRLYVVNPSAVGGSERRSTAGQISQKEQNSSVRRQPVRCRLLGTALDGQTDQSKRTDFFCPSSTSPLSAGSLVEHNGPMRISQNGTTLIF